MPLKIAKYCAVPGCERTQSLHNLPSDSNIRNAWLNFIFKKVPAHVSKTLSVCSLHFAADSFVNKSQFDAGFAERLRLESNAVPSILDPPGMARHTYTKDHSSLLTCEKASSIKTPQPSEGMQGKRECYRCRSKTLIDIGKALPRWRKIQEQKGFKSDIELALYLLNRVFGEVKRGRPRKTPHVSPPQTEESDNDSSQASQDHQSSDIDEDMDVIEISYEESPSCQTDKSEQTKQSLEDLTKPEDQLNTEQLDLDVCKSPVASVLNNEDTVPPSFTLSTEDKQEDLENRLDDSFVRTPSPERAGCKERPLRPKKSQLTGLFPTCLQCGAPVLEYTTVSLGSVKRLQWKCSKGHLMWLFPNNNPS